MKILTPLFLLIALTSFAQKTDIFQIDSLPTEGVLLDKGWKFQMGDNPDFAKTNFDDFAWESINPKLTIPDLQAINSYKSLWLRLKIKKFDAKNILLSINQSGASEIFLNGTKIHSLGIIDTLGIKTKSYDPNGGYILLPLDTSENTLAVRYYFEKDMRYKSVFDVRYPLFSARIFSGNTVLEQDKNKRMFIWKGFDIGVPLILFVVHFIIFLFYTPTKANLWYSLWALFNCISSFFILQIKLEHHIELKNDYSLYASILGILSNLLLFYSLLLLLKEYKKSILVVFFSFSILSLIFFLSDFKYQSIIDLLLSFVYVSIVIYMAYKAYRHGNKGGKYVIYSMVIYILAWTLFILSYNIFSEKVSAMLFHIALFCLPITISILLGLDFRNTNESLITITLEKQKLLENQNEQLEKQVSERTAELKASQNQLIQKEKLASLGELTAGIAHEIQNPLNFVNNFSELSVDLVKDLKDEIEKPVQDKAYIDELFDDLSQNQEKINHHGKRASNIVKGMLEHSRASTGVKELTDINKLADEYLRLSYHGLRAKDKDFNADFTTDFDENMPKIEVIPQDIGRVLLNLINNANIGLKSRSKK